MSGGEGVPDEDASGSNYRCSDELLKRTADFMLERADAARR